MRRYLNVRLKPTTKMTGRLELAVAQLLREPGRTDDVIAVSFLDHSTEIFKLLAPDVHTAVATAQAALFWASSQDGLAGLPNPRCRSTTAPRWSSCSTSGRTASRPTARRCRRRS